MKNDKWVGVINTKRDKFLLTLNFPGNDILIQNGIYSELLAKVFAAQEYLYLCQYINEREDYFLQKTHSTPSIQRKFPICIRFSKDFDDTNTPNNSSMDYVIHILGKNTPTWLEEFIKFNASTSIPNIVYGLKRKPQRWLREVVEINRHILYHTQLRKSENDPFINSLYFLTSDGRPIFYCDSLLKVKKIIKNTQSIAKQHDIEFTYNDETKSI